ncbi:MAG: GNAT family N-acetyltransferase [Desulfitobacteriaceae bacterium]|nr:GNAT family N-acetyltransferase [Desulfitobacteriaceae bacterium]
MFFDAHVHIGKKKFMGKIKNENKELPAYSTIMESPWDKYCKVAIKNKIYKALIFPFPFEEVDLIKANDYIKQAYEMNQELFIPFFLINERLSQEDLEKQNILGIKEHFYITRNADIKAFFHIYEYLQDKNKILYLHPHMNERVDRIRIIHKNFPRLRIILAHSGRKWPFTGDDVLELIIPELKSFEDVYFDTSTILDNKVVSKMVKEIGSHRILFGSDYPFSKPGEDIYQTELKVIDRLDIGDGDKENILQNNFKRLFLKDIWIRRVAKEDRTKLLDIFDSLPPKERKFLALNQKMDIIKSTIRDERHIYVAEDSQDIAGYLRESGRSNNGAIIEELLVKEKYRGKGIAELLVRTVSKKFSYVEAKTLSDNTAVNNLNVKLGFDIIKQSKNGKILNWRKLI